MKATIIGADNMRLTFFKYSIFNYCIIHKLKTRTAAQWKIKLRSEKNCGGIGLRNAFKAQLK